MFWDALKDVTQVNHTKKHFFNIMDIFPEFVRPNIFKILSYAQKQKTRGNCKQIMIYTNNQGDRSWAEMIAAYFNMKIKKDSSKDEYTPALFDQIIAAFKAKGIIVEICRTTHNKSVDDIFRCTQLPKDTQICFLDDQEHPHMKHSNVSYIQVKPFTNSLPFDEMAERYYTHFHPHMKREDFVNRMVNYMKVYSFPVTKKTSNEEHVDKIVGDTMLKHIRKFFTHTNNRSRKHKSRKHRSRKHKSRKTR